ncbi:hypothetical protein Spb1_32260 [Planctopirus ephydatiae]|uniref:Uncharacterized protein n=1 Tax=Planctopirus ephydatiae TaxID=2528019 RepID=A0A518GRS6_9PLAN|nr:hypothetical protein Spb1_32260 [Planctopirus ephydatiae]
MMLRFRIGFSGVAEIAIPDARAYQLIQRVLLCAVIAGQPAGPPICGAGLVSSSDQSVVKPSIESPIEGRELSNPKDFRRPVASPRMMSSLIEGGKMARTV